MSSSRNFAHLFDHSSDVEQFSAGALIYNEGDPGHMMYVIREGHVRIASAAAVTDTTLVPIDQRRFHFMVTQTPRFATDVMAIMAERIKLLLEHAYGAVRK